MAWVGFKIQNRKDLSIAKLIFLSFIGNPENGFEDYKTIPGCLPPSYEIVKGFIRWYANSTYSRLRKSGKPTVRTAKACAERLFGGFKETTGTEVTKTDRKEIYSVSTCCYLTVWSNTNILFGI
jgi:hypothetical protein